MNPAGLKIALERIVRESEVKTGFLDLGALGLTALPKALFKLVDLRRLNLGGEYFDEHRRQEEIESPYGPNLIGKDVGRLVQLRKLESLSLCLTDLGDVEEISTLAGLRELDCSRTWVSDLTPLKDLPDLQLLDCTDAFARGAIVAQEFFRRQLPLQRSPAPHKRVPAPSNPDRIRRRLTRSRVGWNISVCWFPG